MRPPTLAAILSTFIVGMPATAQQVRTNLGTLTCTVADAIAAERKPDSEQRPLSCAFRPTSGGAEQTYAGTIAKVGEGKLPTGKLVLIWVVHGPANAEASPGFLAQSYVGRPAEGSGEPSAVLAGQRDRALTLQASTPAGQPEEEAVTILDLSLSSTPT